MNCLIKILFGKAIKNLANQMRKITDWIEKKARGKTKIYDNEKDEKEYLPSNDCEVDFLESLHKFRGFGVNSEDMLINDYIWFAELGQLNDPFEEVVSFKPEKNLDVIIRREYPCFNSVDVIDYSDYRLVEFFGGRVYSDPEVIIDANKRHIALYNETIKSAREEGYFCILSEFKYLEEIPIYSKEVAQKIGVLSRYSNPDLWSIQEQEEIRMWSHYGDALKGFRITYDPAKILGIPKTMGKFVSYLQSPVVVDASQFFMNKQLMWKPIWDDHVRQDNFETKAKAWSYERELRLRARKPGARRLVSDSIKYVTFGERMPIDQRIVLRKATLVKNKNAKFYIARVSHESYKMIYELWR
jgi:hypothetical protein